MRQIQARKHKKEHYDNMFRFYWSILLWTRKEKLRGIRHTCRTCRTKTQILVLLDTVQDFLTAISHRGLRNCFFDVTSTFSIFFLDFYSPFLFGLLFPFSIWTFFFNFFSTRFQFFFISFSILFLFNGGHISSNFFCLKFIY